MMHFSCAKENLIFEDKGLKFQTVIQNLKIPWSIASWGSNLLITEKDGRLLWYQIESSQLTEVKGVPKVYSGGQGGLMDVVLHPNFQTHPWIYLTYSISTGRGKKTTRVSRALWNQGALKDLKVLFTAEPSLSRSIHFGSRLVFDSKGFIFFSVGDRGNRDRAQSLETHNGKIMRLHDDGRIPEDNPFENSPIWSYGHRNPQGLTFKNDELWAHEHGPRGGDEINLIQKGKNYGWPIVTYGREYIGGKIGEGFSQQGMEDSKKHYIPSIAPSGMIYVSGEKYPQFQDSFLIGSLVFRRLHQVSSVNFSKEDIFLESLSKRVRSLHVDSSGFIYIGVENGSILKILNQ